MIVHSARDKEWLGRFALAYSKQSTFRLGSLTYL